MQGEPRSFPVTNRSVLAIAAPMTLAYLTTPLLGLVDTAVVGQLGDAALLGGLAAGALAFDLVFTTFNFLRSGTTGLVAQAVGRRDAVEEQAVFWRAFAIAAIAGIVLAALAPLLSSLGQGFLGGDDRVAEAMDTYIRIRMLGAPLALINYAILGYILGRGEGMLALGFQVLLNGVNIALSIVFGLWLGWGVAGVAWGTVAGEAAAVAAGMVVLVARFRRSPPLARDRLMDFDAVWRMVALNGDIMVRSFALLVAYALFTRQGAQIGTLTLATNAVLMNLFMVASYFLDGFATAAEQLAGRSIGARDSVAFRRAVRISSCWGFAISAVGGLLVLVFGPALVNLVTTAPDVRQEALYYLPWAALAGLTGVLAFLMDGVYIGATWSRDMRNTMLLSLGAYAVALFTLSGPFGNHGLWAALHLWLVVRGLSLVALLPSRTRRAFQSG